MTRKNSKDRGHISVSAKTHRDFKQACNSKGKAMSWQLEKLINDFLDRQNGAGS